LLMEAKAEMHKVNELVFESNKNIKRSSKKTIQEKMIRTYGDVQLDADMMEYLMLGPDFAVVDKINRLDLEQEYLRGMTIIRWDRMGKDDEDIVPSKTQTDINEVQKIEELTFMAERVYREEDNTLSMTNLKCTQMSTNRKVIMPGPRSAKEEALLQVRRDLWIKESNEYIRINCNKDGEQDNVNLSEAAQRGRIKLLKKVRKKELMILPSDKGKSIVVTTLEMYTRMGQDHTASDREVQWKELKQCQAEMNGNSRALSRIFRVGESSSPANQLRCFDNATSWAQHAPNMRAVPKTHKEPHEEGHPKS
jgi:hypothetical protein